MADATVAVSTTLTMKLVAIGYLASGDLEFRWTLVTSSGAVKKAGIWTMKADGSGVYGEDGSQIASSTPANVFTDATSIKNRFDTAASAAVTAGKVSL